MSSRLKALYEQMILEHNRNPRHFNEIDPCTHHAHGVNPLCGDDFNVYVDCFFGIVKLQPSPKVEVF